MRESDGVDQNWLDCLTAWSDEMLTPPLTCTRLLGAPMDRVVQRTCMVSLSSAYWSRTMAATLDVLTPEAGYVTDVKLGGGRAMETDDIGKRYGASHYELNACFLTYESSAFFFRTHLG
jgi:hypothetical protein